MDHQDVPAVGSYRREFVAADYQNAWLESLSAVVVPVEMVDFPDGVVATVVADEDQFAPAVAAQLEVAGGLHRVADLGVHDHLAGAGVAALVVIVGGADLTPDEVVLAVSGVVGRDELAGPAAAVESDEVQ